MPITSLEDIYKCKISILRQREFCTRKYKKQTKYPYFPCSIGQFTIKELHNILMTVIGNPFQKSHYITLPSGHYLVEVNEVQESNDAAD